MNIEIARKRYKDVFLPDVIDNSQGDFLAKHVQMRHLYLTDHADLLPQDKKSSLSETDIYEHIFVENYDDDQFVLVKGASGAGKSHLIRWFESTLRIRKDDSEIVLYIRRADNSLKGTIKQLIDLPEVKNLTDKELYKKLVSASTKIPEPEFKNQLYYGFVNLIDSDENIDDEDADDLINHATRRHLVALLQNSLFKERLMESGGPIDRIYIKIAENNTNDVNDQAAQFEYEDFEIDSSLPTDLLSMGADIKAQKLAKKLVDNQDLTNSIVRYMNHFIEKVVQRCTGLAPGDLSSAIENIRHELFKQNKTLTILIEDISSASGVDDSLLDALLTKRSGYLDKELCRLNAVVGVADGYYRDNIRTNTKGRIKKYVIVPDEMFNNDTNGLIEFVARYLNTVSLEEKTIDEWLKGQADPSNYPIHTVTIGEGWGECRIGSKGINLFPFTRNAIISLYKNLDATQRNPRAIMRNLIEPYIDDVLNNYEEFPSIRPALVGIDFKLQDMIYNRSDLDDNTKIRLSTFMYIWGDGSSNIYVDKGIKYIAGLPEQIYRDLKLPIIDGTIVSKPKVDPDTTSSVEIPLPPPSAEVETTENKQVILALKEVDKWIQDKNYKINFAATTASARPLNEARKYMNNYLFDVIDWVSEGISIDLYNRIKDRTLISFERQTTSKSIESSIITLPATLETRRIIEAFVRWTYVGNHSWNFPNSSDFLYIVQKWTESVKPQLVNEFLNYSGKGVDYFSFAVAAEFYRLILNGYCNNFQKAENLNTDVLLQVNESVSKENGHTKKWNDLKDIMNSPDGELNRNCVLQYYNLVQGTALSSTNYEIDYIPFNKAVRRVVNTGLYFEESALQLDDPIPKRRRSSEYLKKILDRTSAVVDEEKTAIKEAIEQIQSVMPLEELVDESSIKDAVDGIRKLYTQAQNSHISIGVRMDNPLLLNCKKNAGSIYSSIKIAQQILDTEDIVECLLKMSRDPLYSLSPFIQLLKKTQVDVTKATVEINERIKNASDVDNKNGTEEYSNEKSVIAQCKAMIKELK